jgi:hypothetical protein
MRDKGGSVATAAEIAAAVEIDDIKPLRQVRALVQWVGDGRALTQTGRLRLADARELVTLLGSGDDLDPMNGRFRTTSSADLRGLCLLVDWAKACGLVRVVHGRLVAVKKHARLIDRPSELWDRMFDAFPKLGAALCRDGWAQSFVRDEFEEVIGAVLLRTYRGGATITISDACELGWEIATARYLLDGAPEQHRTTWRMTNDRDVRHALATLETLGALRRAGDSVLLTERGLDGMRRAAGDPLPGDAILQVNLTLCDVADPAVWRRLLVPAAIRLDRLHEVIQVAMGWENYHLHEFSAGGASYGPPIPDLEHVRDERRMTLDRLLGGPRGRLRYTYDFGDGWEHDVVVERVLEADPGRTYPACIGGQGRCPPEDCGGSWGYANLRETLADPRHDEHEQMLEWLGLRAASEFDPAAFDTGEVNASL